MSILRGSFKDMPASFSTPAAVVVVVSDVVVIVIAVVVVIVVVVIVIVSHCIMIHRMTRNKSLE